jgi:predicted DNA-binding helix-hairpin-helix protein
MIKPMRFVKNELIQYKEEEKFKSTPKFAPAGQAQVIVGYEHRKRFSNHSVWIIL